MIAGRVARAAITIFVIMATGCSFSFASQAYSEAEKALKNQNYKLAISDFRKVIERNPKSSLAMKSARQAARVAFFNTKNYLQSIEFYNHLVKYSRSETERVKSQRAIADIYFANLSDYPKAIAEYNKLLLVETNRKEIVKERFNLARSYFYMDRFYDSKDQIKDALKLAKSRRQQFELKMFLASIYFNMKDNNKALAVYSYLGHNFPKRAKAENIALNESICYESENRLNKAIATLKTIESTYKDPEFIALKIKRLRELESNTPGDHGHFQ